MQSDPKEIYKLTAERTGKSEQVYKDIGNFVFAKLYSELRKPKKLIIKLKGVGNWELRRKRMRIAIDMFPPNFERQKEDFPSEVEFLKNENKKELHQIFKERLKDYDEFIKLRDEIRKVRNETQTIIPPANRED
jgi:hypothetical protein